MDPPDRVVLPRSIFGDVRRAGAAQHEKLRQWQFLFAAAVNRARYLNLENEAARLQQLLKAYGTYIAANSGASEPFARLEYRLLPPATLHHGTLLRLSGSGAEARA